MVFAGPEAEPLPDGPLCCLGTRGRVRSPGCVAPSHDLGNRLGSYASTLVISGRTRWDGRAIIFGLLRAATQLEL